MKKRTIISLLLVACMATMCFVGGTFAKYASTVNSAAEQAQVAKWSFTDGKNSGAEIVGGTVTFDLFGAGCLDDSGTDVADGKIAPGTQGSFAFSITNESEVNATYAITFAVTNDSDIPIVITYNEKAYAWDAEQNKFMNGSDVLAIPATAINMDATATPTLSWAWAFGDDSTIATDTPLGVAAPTISITATCTFTQVD